MKDRNRGKNTIPEMEKSNTLLFLVGIGYEASTSLPCLNMKTLDTDSRREKDCLILNLIGVVNIHNSNLKSQMFKKGVSFQRGPSINFKKYG